jgi:hypothetical protein
MSDFSTAPGEEESTQRFAGVVVLVVINYEGDLTFTLRRRAMSYSYKAYLVRGEEAKVEQTIYHEDESITVLNRHGIRIVFQQTGAIGRFYFVNFLLNVRIATIALILMCRSWRRLPCWRLEVM